VRTTAIRAIKEIIFMHDRINTLPEVFEKDPPSEYGGKHPSLGISRAQFIREAEKEWRVSELLVEDVLVLEEQAMRKGSVWLQSDVSI
jgi:hypothetical protein